MGGINADKCIERLGTVDLDCIMPVSGMRIGLQPAARFFI